MTTQFNTSTILPNAVFVLGIPSEVSSLILLTTFILCFGIPLIISIVYCMKPRSHPKYEPVAQDTVISEKHEDWKPPNRQENKKVSIATLLQDLPANLNLIDPLCLRAGEVLVHKKKQVNKEEKNQQKRRKDGQKESGDSFRLNIQASDFQTIFEELGYNPVKLLCLEAEERDPSKSLIQNWFEYCQPVFEVPDKLTTLCGSNPSVDRNPKHRAWDNTAYLVDKKHFIKATSVPLPGNSEASIIVCQAPIDDKEIGKKDTRGLFWKMIHEQKSDIIVMACRHKEKGVVACGKYFPEEMRAGEVFGDYKVTLAECREMFEGELVARRLEYYSKKAKVIAPASVLHYQFTNWEEGTIPKSPMAIDAIKFVIHQARRQGRAVIIHSSIGTGRASVLAGIEYLSWSVSVSKFTSTHLFQVDFRTKVMGGIQNGEQLLFTQNIALEMIMKSLGCTSYEDEMKKQWGYLKNYYDTGTNNLNDLKQLETIEQDRFGQKVAFSGVPGFQRLVVTKDEERLKSKPKTGKDILQGQLAEVRKKKEGKVGNKEHTVTGTPIVDELDKDKNNTTAKTEENEKTGLAKIDNKDKTTKTYDPFNAITVNTTTVADQITTEMTTTRNAPDEPKTAPKEEPKDDAADKKMDQDAAEK